MRKFYALLISILLIYQPSDAQVWQWSKNAGNFHSHLNGWNRIPGYGVATDQFNNLYSIGTFIDTLNLVDTTIRSIGASPGTKNLFIVKYDESGYRQWIKVMQGVFSFDESRVANSTIRVNSEGDIIFSGEARDGTLLGQPLNDWYFLCKMKQDGTLVWVRTFRTDVRFTLDDADQIYVHLAVVGNNAGNFGTQALSPINSYAVGKLDTDGVTQWVKQYASSSAFNIQNPTVEVSPSGSELLFSCALTDAVTLEGTTLPVFSDQSILVRLSSIDGSLKKIIEMRTNEQARITHAQWATDTTIIFSFSRYITNNNPTATVNNLPIPLNLTINGAEYIALVAIDTAATEVKWVQKIFCTEPVSGSSHTKAHCIAVKNNNVYVAGSVSPTAQIDNVIFYTQGYAMGFLARFDAQTGNFKNFTIGGSANGRNAFNNVAITHDENIYAGGYHNDYSLIPSPQYMFPVVMGNDSLPVLGGHQFLLGKLKGNSNLLKGRVYADFNNNGIFSGYDAPIQNLLINHQPSNSLNSSHLEGYYQVSVDTGDYLLTPQINVPPYFDVAPISRNGNLASTGNEIDELDFRLVPTGNFKEVSIDITQINRLRAGSQVQYMVNYKNNGTNMASGEYYLVFDNALQFLTSDSAASGTFSDSLVFQYVNLAPFESRSNALSFSTGTTLTFADTLNIRSVILPVAGDTIPSNNTYALDSPVFGPFDPNQKTVLPKESIRIGDALAGTQEVEYTLQFQNTGNDTAFNVIVTDSLSGLLNINTLRLISSSHPFKLNVISNNLLEFRFMNIMLVDSFQNEPKSHGFVKFRIKPHTSVSLIDTIYNNCHIFFDYNLPITTNTVKTFFKTPDVPPLVDSVAFISFTAFKSNNESVLQWSTNYEQNLDHYEIQRSPDSMNFVTIGQKNGLGTNGGSYTHSDISPVHGLNYYRLKTVFASGNSRLSQIVMVDHTPVIVNAGFSIGPVPAKDYLRINLGDIQLPVSATADIYDGLGRLVIKNVANVNSPSYNINISSLSAGMYFIRIVLGREVYEKAFSK